MDEGPVLNSELLDRRRAELVNVAAESRPVADEFLARLGLWQGSSAPHFIGNSTSAVDNWLSNQVITDEDHNWITVRLAYLIAEVIMERHGGEWLLCEDSRRRSFGRYVVGNMPSAPGFLFDCFEAAHHLASQSPPRSLEAIIAELEDDAGIRGNSA